MKARRSRAERTGATVTIAEGSESGRERRRRLEGRLDDAHLPADAVEDLEDEVELFVGVGRDVGRAQAGGLLGDGGRDDRVCEDAVVEERLPELVRLEVVADDDRDDRRLAVADVVAERGEARPHLSRVGPEPLPALWLLVHDV